MFFSEVTVIRQLNAFLILDSDSPPFVEESPRFEEELTI